MATLQTKLYPACNAGQYYSFRSIRGILSTVLALLQDVRSAFTGSAEPIVRVIAGIGALVMVFLIIFRRKKRERDKS